MEHAHKSLTRWVAAPGVGGMAVALLWLTTSLGFSMAAHAQSSSAPYLTAYRYQPGSALLVGTISPAPNGASNFPATRYTYSSGLLKSVETGVLAAWQSDSIQPSNWTGFTVGKMITYNYDTNGRKVLETAIGYQNGGSSGATNVTQYTYDDLDRLTCTAVRMNLGSLPASACTLGTAGTYGPDRITQNTYDALNRLTQVTKALGTSSQEVYAAYTYTADSQQQYITDANKNETELAYDGFDRLADWYFPSKSSQNSVDTSDYEAYGYDLNGNRTSLRKRDGENITYQFDPLNRMSAKQLPTASQSVSYGYDLRGLMTSATFTSSGVGITNTYDGFGRLTSTQSTMGGVSRTVSQGYDNDGDRTSVTFPDANYFDYDYDGLDRLSDVRENGGATIVSESYEPIGLLSGETRGGVSSTYGYDSAERPQSWEDTFISAGPNVTITLSYSPADQIASRTRNNDAYAYTGYVNGTTAYSPNGLNQYASVGGNSVGYDPNGNLTSDGSTSTAYTYDTENRLLTVTSTSYNAILIYDPLGRLFQVTGNSGTRQFLYDGDQLVAEYNGTSAALLRRYVQGPAGDDPLIWYEGSSVSSGTRRSLQEDYKGSILSVADASGNVLAINRYDEYGAPSADNLGTLQYTGQAWLPEAGLYYYKARMYNPRLGRFMQTDPVGYKGDLDLYAYVGNDPLDKSDPTGMYSCGTSLTGTQCSQMLQAQQLAVKTISSTISTLKGAESNMSSGRKLTSAQQSAVGVVSKVMGNADAKTISAVISGGEKMLSVLKGAIPVEYGGKSAELYANTDPGVKLTVYGSYFNASPGQQAETIAHESAHEGLRIPDLPPMYQGDNKPFLPRLGVTLLHQSIAEFGTNEMLRTPDALAISLGLRHTDGYQ